MTTNTNVFVSYSRADVSLVGPIVKLLRVNKALVFQDIDDIQPGKRWRSEIAKALTESHLIVVFWCDHAHRSEQVSNEWKAAVEQAKDVLPLLLDATPLPQPLSEFQWIDFRGIVGANHSSIGSGSSYDEIRPNAPSPRSARRGLALAGLAAAFGIALFVFLFTFNSPDVPLPSPPVYEKPTLRPPQESFPLLPIVLLLGVAVAAWLAWLLRRRAKRRASIETTIRPPGEVERCIATELEAEILRRTALSRDSPIR